jgi:hypothetical protein
MTVNRFARAAVVVASTTAVSVAVAVPAGTAFAEDGVTVVATGFAGPLHIATAPNGALIVADAFAGELKSVNPKTGAVSTLVSEQGFVPGVGIKGQQYFYPFSTGGEFEQGTAVLMRSTPGGQKSQVADMLAYELAHNPDGQPRVDDADSNPYSVLALPGRVIVADAAANDLVEIRSNGAMRTLTVFPVSHKGDCATAENNGVENGGCDPVPTDLALEPDGTLVVTGLGAFAEGHIWGVDANTGEILFHEDGFPPLTGITVGPDGTGYAVSPFAGLVFRHDGSTGAVSAAQVPGVTDAAVGKDGTLYATTADLEGGAPGSVVSVAQSAFH